MFKQNAPHRQRIEEKLPQGTDSFVPFSFSFTEYYCIGSIMTKPKDQAHCEPKPPGDAICNISHSLT